MEFNPLSKGSTLYAYASRPTHSMMRSDDGGLNWRRIMAGVVRKDGNVLLEVKQIFCLPSDTSVLLMACNTGLYRSTNGGDNWSLSNTNNDILGETITYAAPIDAIYYGQYFQRSVYRSRDHGATWTVVGPEGQLVDMCALAVSPNSPDRLLAGSNFGGVSLSTDGGRSWSPSLINIQDSQFKLPPEVPKILFNHRYPNVAYVTRWLATPGLSISYDSGGSWQSLGGNSFARSWAIEIDGRAGREMASISGPIPRVLWLGLFEGRKRDHSLYESIDGGGTWKPVALPPIARVWTLRFDTTTARLAAATSSGLYMASSRP